MAYRDLWQRSRKKDHGHQRNHGRLQMDHGIHQRHQNGNQSPYWDQHENRQSQLIPLSHIGHRYLSSWLNKRTTIHKNDTINFK